jgi:hypothetical protein
MRRLFLLLTLAFSGCIPFGSAHAEEISRQAIIETIEHLRALVHDSEEQVAAAEADLTKLQSQFETQHSELLAAQKEAQLMAEQAHENAKERDVVVIAFALVMALYVGTFFAGPVMRDFPDPWNLVAAALCYLTVGLTAYGLGRLALHSLAAFLP